MSDSKPDLHLVADKMHVPFHLRAQPNLSKIFVIDDTMPIIPFVKKLASVGLCVINHASGQLVITDQPEAFRISQTPGS